MMLDLAEICAQVTILSKGFSLSNIWFVKKKSAEDG